MIEKHKRVVLLKVVYDPTDKEFILTRRDKAGELIEKKVFSSFNQVQGKLKNLWGK